MLALLTVLEREITCKGVFLLLLNIFCFCQDSPNKITCLVDWQPLGKGRSGILIKFRSFSSVPDNFLKNLADWDFQWGFLERVDRGLYMFNEYIKTLLYLIISKRNHSQKNHIKELSYFQDDDCSQDISLEGDKSIKMDSSTLLEVPQKNEKIIEKSLIQRYNVFVRNYNQPSCIVEGVLLQELPPSTVHDKYFLVFNNWKGKLLLGIFLLIPGLDLLFFLLCLYALIIYWRCLRIHQQNEKLVSDPFKNMVYDHDLCFKLNKDYNSFSIEFKELEGFSLNYNRDMRKQLRLREQRGKVNFFIYNGNFWASYHHLPKWKTFHLVLFLISAILSAAMNLLFFLLFLK